MTFFLSSARQLLTLKDEEVATLERLGIRQLNAREITDQFESHYEAVDAGGTAPVPVPRSGLSVIPLAGDDSELAVSASFGVTLSDAIAGAINEGSNLVYMVAFDRRYIMAAEVDRFTWSAFKGFRLHAPYYAFLVGRWGANFQACIDCDLKITFLTWSNGANASFIGRAAEFWIERFPSEFVDVAQSDQDLIALVNKLIVPSIPGMASILG